MAIPSDHPHRHLFARLEKQAANDIAAALDRLRRDVMRGINRSNAATIYSRLRDQEINERLRLGIYEALLPTIDAATEKAQEELERQVLGVKFIGDLDFSWELANEKARDWLRRHSFDLTYANVFSVTETTIERIRKHVDDFILTGEMTINDFANRIAPEFGINRATTIAVTEVTRAYAHGNQEAWREAGIIEKQRWNTAVDELVCPICSPLNGVVVGLNETWAGGIDSPPAHPRCRCWVTPVVEVATNE